MSIFVTNGALCMYRVTDRLIKKAGFLSHLQPHEPILCAGQARLCCCINNTRQSGSDRFACHQIILV